MDNALTSVLIGVAASLVTIFLTPLVQQYFWIGRQREELRLKTVKLSGEEAGEIIRKTR